MSDWGEIKNKIGKAAGKAVKKTEEIADVAKKQIKLKSYDSKLSSKYESLGRLTYKQIKCGESQAESISTVISEIDELRVKRSDLANEIEADKVRRAKEKEEAKKQAKIEKEEREKAKAEEMAASAMEAEETVE